MEPTQKPSIDMLMKLIGQQQQPQNDLEKLAATQVTNQPMYDSRPEGIADVWKRLRGVGASPEQSRALNQMYGSVLNRDKTKQTGAGALSEGFEKGKQLMDEVRMREKKEKMAGPQASIENAQRQFDNTRDVYGAMQKDQEIAARSVDDALKRQQLELQRRRLKLDMDKQANPDISVNTEKAYAETMDSATQANQSARTATQLANELRQVDTSGGVPTRVGEYMKRLTGNEDWTTGLYMQARAITVKDAIANLPPGVASDKDVEIVMSATPEQFANPAFLAAYLESYATLQQKVAEYNQAKVDFMDQNRSKGHSVVGFNDYWKFMNIPQGAKELLKSDPEKYREFFVKKYGQGMADKVLK